MAYQKFENPNAAIKAIRTLHIALILGQVSFAAVAAFISYSETNDDAAEGLAQPLNFIVPIALLIGLALGYFLFNMKIKTVQTKPDLLEKLNDYRSAMVLRDVMWEFPTLLALVATLITHQFYFLAFAAAGVLLFVLNIPTRQKIVTALQLNPSEEMQLAD